MNDDVRHNHARRVPRKEMSDKVRPKSDHSSSASVFEMAEGEEAVSFLISSQLAMAHRILCESREYMFQFGIESYPEFLKVLNELLANAIIHGNKNNPEKRVACEIGRVRNLLFKITVKDQGDGFDYRDIDIPVAWGPGSKQSGYAAIHSLSEQVEFNLRGNKVTAYVEIPRETAYYTWDDGKWKVIQPTGSISASSVSQLKKILAGLIESDHAKYRFDFADVEDMDSISLTVFVVFANMLAKRNIDSEITVVNGGENIKSLFDMTRLDRHYRFI